MQQQTQQLNLRKKKKARLDKSYYATGQQKYDFYLCGTYEKDGEKLFTKWKKYSECIFPVDFDGTSDNWKIQKFFDEINQKQIIPSELVLDVEEKKKIKPIVTTLKNLESVDEYFIYDTGSKGYHVHIFLSNEEFSEKEKLFLIKKFGVDAQKASSKTMIALENCPHWKTGKIKRQISEEEILDDK